MEKIKIVYEDNGRDKAVVGEKKAEDDLFITIVDKYGSDITIAKSRIVLLKKLSARDYYD